jgi:hypothetical protein
MHQLRHVGPSHDSLQHLGTTGHREPVQLGRTRVNHQKDYTGQQHQQGNLVLALDAKSELAVVVGAHREGVPRVCGHNLTTASRAHHKRPVTTQAPASSIHHVDQIHGQKIHLPIRTCKVP